MPSSPGTFIARRGQLRARFSAAGVDVGQGSPVLRLGLFGVGHGKALTPVAQVAPAVWESRVVYLHPGLSEWFANAPEGLEQGFLLTQRPDGSGPLTLLVGRVSDRSRRVASTESAITVDGLRYGDLTAIDARGRGLSTRLILSGRQLLLVVDDGHASYPLRIDPTTKLARRSRPR